MEAPRYGTEEELRALALAFESCMLPPGRWHHEEHLMIALHYARRRDVGEATALVRDGIMRLNAHHGVATTRDRGYHETVTAFFVHMVSLLVRDLGPDRPLPEVAAAVLAALGDKWVALRYYSRERLTSPEARAGWIDPDLRPLPGR